jgi:hypothetical protein
MKKILTFLFMLALVPFVQAQWVVDTYDNGVGPVAGATGPKWADVPVRDVNFYANGVNPEFFLSNNADHMHGVGSMKLDYRIEAYDGWGGYVVRTNYHDFVTADLPYIDLSAGTNLKLRYKILTPANLTQTGTAYVELKICEFDAQNARDIYYHHTPIDLSDASGEWKEVIMPLKLDPSGNNTLGFTLQSGDQASHEFEPHTVKGFEIAVVYLTSGSTTNTPVATGSLLWDKFELVGNKYEPILTFDNSALTWGLDNMGWNAIPGAIAVSDEAVDTAQGGSLKVDYTLSAPEVWGGFVAIDTSITVDSTIAQKTALTLFVKNTAPVAADSGRAFIRVFLMENSAGVNEEWIIDANVDLSEAFDWTRCYLPLVPKPMGVNDRFPPKDGFALKNGAGDQEFNPKFLTKIRIEIFGRGTEDGFTGALLANGSLLLDVMQQSGFKYDDNEAPAAPGNIFVFNSPDPYKNLVSWEDVPGEANEKYTIYASLSPITDITASNVDLIATGISHGTQVFNHRIIAPVINQNLTYHYAIVCKDLAGNIGEPGFSAPHTNTAKGVTVVSQVVPTPFTADGNLTEWQSIPHFSLYPSNGSATISPGFVVTNDADCSADMWVAIDLNYLYYAALIYDDIFYPVDPALSSWQLDSPDLFIGLYDWKQAMHTTYQRGSEPDYQIRFNEGVARNDDYTCEYDSLLVEGENYYFGELAPIGYVVEARISLNDLATLRKRPEALTDTINIKLGDRVPIDFGINDNEGTATVREGLIFYSSTNNDAGHNNPAVWSYTWVTGWPVGVEDEGTQLNSFSLAQNYPNPFNPATLIRYSIAQAGLVTLKVYDVLGRQVAELVNEEKSAGSYDITFDASRLASGVYMYKIESGSYQQTKKMILIK